VPRIIFKCPHIKGGAQGGAAHLGNYVRYMATREGAEQFLSNRPQLPATKKQEKLVEQIVHDFPLSRSLFEYEDYLTEPTRANASDFISRALEDNYDLAAKKNNYIQYIGQRPRAQKLGAHALFNGRSEPLVLSHAADEVAHHNGTVWLPIISLRREDAARLGYDSPEQWQAFLSAQAPKIAAAMKIPLDQFRWYAAFHNESHHPHVHMVCYSADGKSGFLTREGIAEIKAGLAKDIFRQELLELYEEQTQHRDALTREAGEVMTQLIEQMRLGTMDNQKLEQLVSHLSEKLRHTSGKMQYGYLKAPVKALVDEIVDELSKDPRIAKAYELWYLLREEVLRTYRDDLPERLPLSQQKEFKRIKNIVIEEAVQLGVLSEVFHDKDTAEEQQDTGENGSADMDIPQEVIPDTHIMDMAESDMPLEETPELSVSWTDRYRAARSFLYGSEGQPQDHEEALRLFLEEAQTGNALAMHDLGRMYTAGLGCEADKSQSKEWYAKALAAFHAVEEAAPGRYVEYRIGKMYAAGLGAERDYTQAADWFQAAADQGHHYAQYSLAGLYYHGHGVEQDYEKALKLYQRAAARGFPYASYELAKMYRDGIGCEKDTALSEKHFAAAYDGFRRLERQSHDDRLQYRIGWMLLHGAGTVRDETEAREWFEKAAQLGNSHAQYQLAKLLLGDPSAEPLETESAVEWLIRAAEAGEQSAQYALGKLYRDGGASLEKDVTKAARWFEKAAAQGSEYAQYALGKLLLDGGDTRSAMFWLGLSADAGNQFAQYALAKFYLDGESMPKDAQRAAELLRHSAGQGNQFAQYRLGKLLFQGEDIPKNVEEAMRWLTASAQQGNQYAQYALGKLYLLGKEVSQDRESAVHWLTMAAAQGNQYAQFFLDHIQNFRGPSIFSCATRLLHHMSRIFQEERPRGAGCGISFTDKKLRQKIREKKIAAGHKADDHAPEQQIGMQF